MHLVGRYEDKQFEERSVTFNLGEGSELDICDGVEKALEKFKKGEQSRVIIQPKFAFGNLGKEDWNIPPNAVIEYVITLNSFEKVSILQSCNYLKKFIILVLEYCSTEIQKSGKTIICRDLFQLRIRAPLLPGKKQTSLL